jgi:uncharacterized membrane-anchored protein
MSHAIITGPITGQVTLDDGTAYNVTPGVIEVPDEHAAEVAHLISTQYAEHGHPTDPNFTYDATAYTKEG